MTPDNASKTLFENVTAVELLGLSQDELDLIEMRLRLRDMIRSHRRQMGLTQKDLAERCSTHQPRIARMESGEADVSLDSMIRMLLLLGVDATRIGMAIAGMDPEVASGVSAFTRPAVGSTE